MSVPISSGMPGDGAAAESPLFAARRERAFVRSRLRVLERYRERRAAAGLDTAPDDERIEALGATLREWDERVRRLREAGM
jgi:hypothetical protein